MAFIGSTGTARVDGDTVRDYFGLRSDWFTFAVTPRQKGQAQRVEQHDGCRSCSRRWPSPPPAARAATRRVGRRSPTRSSTPR